jgi:hypothetical protein
MGASKSGVAQAHLLLFDQENVYVYVLLDLCFFGDFDSSKS